MHAPAMVYSTLDAGKIEETIEKLGQRIEERFPDRGLVRLCAHLLEIAREDRKRIAWVARPNLLLRASIALVLILGAGGLVWSFIALRRVNVEVEAFNIIQSTEAVINVVALAGAAIWFLLNLESNTRRDRILADLHQLRSIAHVVDMHQLTKDPTTLTADYRETASSTPHNMTPFELTRYLDYCAEMLSLTSKLAALYMQGTRDPVIIETVSEIEELTTNLSQKIWQKTVIVHDASNLA